MATDQPRRMRRVRGTINRATARRGSTGSNNPVISTLELHAAINTAEVREALDRAYNPKPTPPGGPSADPPTLVESRQDAALSICWLIASLLNQAEQHLLHVDMDDEGVWLGLRAPGGKLLAHAAITPDDDGSNLHWEANLG